MTSSKEDAEAEYARLRMADAKIFDDDDGDNLASTSKDPKPPAPQLDDSISADDARELKEEGNALYKSGDYTGALEKYTRAAKSAHAADEDRGIYLANRAAVNLKLQRFEDVVTDTTEALRLKPVYVKALARRKEAYMALKEWRSALEDATQLKESASELRRLQYMAEQKETKDREEAIESLKGLGNSILSNFGMSLDDISMDKDPETGSYSIKMKQ